MFAFFLGLLTISVGSASLFSAGKRKSVRKKAFLSGGIGIGGAKTRRVESLLVVSGGDEKLGQLRRGFGGCVSQGGFWLG
ncbi:hypothetical protein J3F84DRAFT_375737 [Trichoderma pleuroticola]